MLINELSKKTGLSTHTIRFYEKSGLIEGKQNKAVKSNNYFHYDEVTVEKLEFISDAKSVGFTIREIGQMIDAWYNQKYTKEQKLEILDDKLISLEQKMKEIKEMKKQIIEFKDDVLNDRC
ncbi:MerR family transcriptional regulator [Aquirufa rosea]|uniref:MerR family transcriptional regulator n=1 Tax=Aquirufa rosea TaxID=2509241 RepID=A0A4Q1BZI9_9BACT|nr:MerR family transcriptional regulator [Aquirufa rosea]RXK48988.1 MerR family transcriptional regulator [Aquirufa rosea]